MLFVKDKSLILSGFIIALTFVIGYFKDFFLTVFIAIQKAELEAKAASDAAIAKQVETAIAKAVETQVALGQSGTEKLLAEVEKRFADESVKMADLTAALNEKSAEILALQKSKMSFS